MAMDTGDEDQTEDRLAQLEKVTAGQADQLKKLERRVVDQNTTLGFVRASNLRSLMVASFSMAVILLPAMTWFVDDDNERFDSGWSIGGTDDNLFLLTGLLTTVIGILGLVAAVSRSFGFRVTTAVLAIGDALLLAFSPLHRDSPDYPDYSEWDQTGALTLLYLALVMLAMFVGMAGWQDREVGRTQHVERPTLRDAW